MTHDECSRMLPAEKTFCMTYVWRMREYLPWDGTYYDRPFVRTADDRSHDIHGRVNSIKNFVLWHSVLQLRSVHGPLYQLHFGGHQLRTRHSNHCG